MHRVGDGGFTLVEVLVALFVLAVGVIGAAGAQNMAAQTRHGAAQLAAAAQLATSLAESMAANSAQLAAADLDDAAATAASTFPGGQVRVCRDSAGAPLAWDCAPAAGAPLVIKVGWRAPEFTVFVAAVVPEAP